MADTRQPMLPETDDCGCKYFPSPELTGFGRDGCREAWGKEGLSVA